MLKQNILNVSAYVICPKPEDFLCLRNNFLLPFLFYCFLIFCSILFKVQVMYCWAKYDEHLYFKDKKGISYYIIFLFYLFVLII